MNSGSNSLTSLLQTLGYSGAEAGTREVYARSVWRSVGQGGRSRTLPSRSVGWEDSGILGNLPVFCGNHRVWDNNAHDF